LLGAGPLPASSRLSNLKTVLCERAEEEGVSQSTRGGGACEPGFVYIDVEYLPQDAGRSPRSYLFVAIKRITRWVYLEIRKIRGTASAKAFLTVLIRKSPFKVRKVLTDNGKEFTDRFSTAGERKPTGNHPVYRKEAIEHRLILPGTRRPTVWWNASTDAFPRSCKSTGFDSSADLNRPLKINWTEGAFLAVSSG